MTATALAGPPLLLDTTVYIDVLRGDLPIAVEDLMRGRQINHSAIALSELAHGLGRLDPDHRGTEKVAKTIAQAIDDVPSHRLAAPSCQCVVEAGILSGVVARLRTFADEQRQAFFNDAVLFLQAVEQGCCLLSRNVADFDCLLQLVPAGRVILYTR